MQKNIFPTVLEQLLEVREQIDYRAVLVASLQVYALIIKGNPLHKKNNIKFLSA